MHFLIVAGQSLASVFEVFPFSVVFSISARNHVVPTEQFIRLQGSPQPRIHCEKPLSSIPGLI